MWLRSFFKTGLLIFLFLDGVAGNHTLEGLCLSQHFCTGTNPFTLPPTISGTKPCCMACSCDPDCINIGNCCPDVGDVGPPVRPLDCILPVVNPDSRLRLYNETKVIHTIQRYRAVTSCPQSIADESLKFKCEMKKAEYPGDLVIVADPQGHLFKNEFCARCNGVESFTPWLIRLRSPSLDVALSYTPSRPFSHFEECVFWTEPPNPEMYEGSRCYSSINKCNETGLWSGSESPFLELMCNSVSMYYMHAEKGIFSVYKNVFCFLCNAVKFAEPNEFCKFEKRLLQTGGSKTFSAILNFLPTAIAPIQDDWRAHGCDETEVFDELFNMCRKLICPRFSLPLYGQCQNQFEQIYGVNLAVTFTVRMIDIPDRNSKVTVYNNPYIVFSTIETALGLHLHFIRCQYFDGFKYENDLLHFAFRTVYTNTEIPNDLNRLQSILRESNETFYQGIDFEFRFGQVRGFPSILPGDTDLLEEGYVMYPPRRATIPGGIASSNCGNHTVNFTTTEPCPRIELSVSEYERLKTQSNKLPETHLTSETNETSRYAICKDDYMALPSAGQETVAHVRPFLLMSVALLSWLEF